MTVTIAALRRSDRPAITRTEAAEALGVDLRTLSYGIADGTIPSIRIGRRVVIPKDRFLALFDVPSEKP